jgi:hypothetical protein
MHYKVVKVYSTYRYRTTKKDGFSRSQTPTDVESWNSAKLDRQAKQLPIDHRQRLLLQLFAIITLTTVFRIISQEYEEDQIIEKTTVKFASLLTLPDNLKDQPTTKIENSKNLLGPLYFHKDE